MYEAYPLHLRVNGSGYALSHLTGDNAWPAGMHRVASVRQGCGRVQAELSVHTEIGMLKSSPAVGTQCNTTTSTTLGDPR